MTWRHMIRFSQNGPTEITNNKIEHGVEDSHLHSDTRHLCKANIPTWKPATPYHPNSLQAIPVIESCRLSFPAISITMWKAMMPIPTWWLKSTATTAKLRQDIRNCGSLKHGEFDKLPKKPPTEIHSILQTLFQIHVLWKVWQSGNLETSFRAHASRKKHQTRGSSTFDPTWPGDTTGSFWVRSEEALNL